MFIFDVLLYIRVCREADVCWCNSAFAGFARVFGCCWRAREVTSVTMLENGTENEEKKPLEMYYNGL
jgi:hypothetical protein